VVREHADWHLIWEPDRRWEPDANYHDDVEESDVS
jgi:hypothetical protein